MKTSQLIYRINGNTYCWRYSTLRVGLCDFSNQWFDREFKGQRKALWVLKSMKTTVSHSSLHFEFWKQKKRLVQQVHRLRCTQRIPFHFKSPLSLDKNKNKNNNKSSQHKKQHRKCISNTVGGTTKKKQLKTRENKKTKQKKNFNMPLCSLGKFSFTESHWFY